MKLKKCKTCGRYTLKEVCPNCSNKTSDAHYKFVKRKNVMDEKKEAYK